MSTNGSKRPNVGTATKPALKIAKPKPAAKPVVRDMSKRKAEVRAEIITALS